MGISQRCTSACIPSTLVICRCASHPATSKRNCKDGYVFRLARPSDKVCVPPASKTQSDADNAAADSRKIVMSTAMTLAWKDMSGARPSRAIMFV